MPAAPTPPNPALLPGAAGVCRAALGEAVLPALLQRVQGPRDHHVWGELPPWPVRFVSPEPQGAQPGRPALALCSGRGVGPPVAVSPPARCPHSTPSAEDAP